MPGEFGGEIRELLWDKATKDIAAVNARLWYASRMGAQVLRDWEERKPPAGGAFLVGNAQTHTGFPGDVCLDKLIERFGVASTDLTLVHLFNLQP